MVGVQQASTGSLAGVSSSQKVTEEEFVLSAHRQECWLVCSNVWRPGLTVYLDVLTAEW